MTASHRIVPLDRLFQSQANSLATEPITFMTSEPMLAERHDLYFLLPEHATIVEIGDLTPTKPPESQRASVDVAESRMRAAARGEVPRRPPITVFETEAGLYIRDGNATFGAALRNGWRTLPVVVEGSAE